MDILFFIIIIYFTTCSKKVPPYKEAIVRRNKEIYKRYKAGESFYINPFTDTVEFISKNRNEPKVNYINPMNAAPIIPKGQKVFSINSSYFLKSLDGKSLSVKIYALIKMNTTSSMATTSFETELKKKVISYYSQFDYEEISTNATKHELLLFDLLRSDINNESIKLEKFEATPSNARITTKNTTKSSCTHYDDTPKKKYSPNDPKYSYSAGNAIKSSLTDTISEQRNNPISSYEINSDNPIRETINISKLISGKNMIDVDNMDSNVDPIDNKI